MYRSQDSWDVVNEPFNDDGTWRQDVFYNVLGTTYPAIALKAARAADPNAKLYINDYNIEQSGTYLYLVLTGSDRLHMAILSLPGAKATAMLNLVKQLIADGVPIDGVGFQCHFIVGEVPGTFQTVLEQFTALGLEVAITELDIRTTTPASQSALAQQQKDYQSVVQACMNVDGCVGITVWDFTDKYSWVPSTFSGQGAACPWDQVRRYMLIVSGQMLTASYGTEPRQEARIQWYRCCAHVMIRAFRGLLYRLKMYHHVRFSFAGMNAMLRLHYLTSFASFADMFHTRQGRSSPLLVGGAHFNGWLESAIHSSDGILTIEFPSPRGPVLLDKVQVALKVRSASRHDGGFQPGAYLRDAVCVQSDIGVVYPCLTARGRPVGEDCWGLGQQVAKS